jgi:hypothetical protein
MLKKKKRKRRLRIELKHLLHTCMSDLTDSDYAYFHNSLHLLHKHLHTKYKYKIRKATSLFSHLPVLVRCSLVQLLRLRQLYTGLGPN